MSFLNGIEIEVSRDLDMLAEVTKTNLGCDMVFISVSRHDKLYSIGLDLDSAQVPANRLHDALDTVCSVTVGKNETVALENASTNPDFSNLPYVSEGVVVAYLGVPLRVEPTSPYGAICAVSGTPRKWAPKDRAFLENLSVVVSSLITNEVQKSEMHELHDAIRENDLVLMTLADKISDLISVHGRDGTLLFSSLGLTRLAAEDVVTETASKILKGMPSSNKTSSRTNWSDLGLFEVFGTQLCTRSGLLKQFETSVAPSANGTYYFKWTPLDTTRTH